MKISKYILFSLIAVPFMSKTCEIGPGTHGCNLSGELRPKLVKTVSRYTELENQRKNLEAKIKGLKHKPADKKALQQELAQVEAEIQSLNLHISLPTKQPYHKSIPTKKSSPLAALQDNIIKIQKENFELAKEIGSTYFKHRGGPYEEMSMEQEEEEEARYQIRDFQYLLKAEINTNASLQKQLTAAKKYYSAAL